MGVVTVAGGGPATPYVVTGVPVFCQGHPPDEWQPAQAAVIIDQAVRYKTDFTI